jgi:hypothetical protein
MTLQEMFDTTIQFLHDQGGPSLAPPDDGGEPRCAYRGDGGRRCSVGFWIPDDRYDPDMEGKTITAKYGISFGLISSQLPAEVLEVTNAILLLQRLQTTHDGARRRYQWNDDIRRSDIVWDTERTDFGSLLHRLVRVAAELDLNTHRLEALWPQAALVPRCPAR